MSEGEDIFDDLIEKLEAESVRKPILNKSAAALHQLLHGTAWTTSSELLGEVGLELLRIQRDYEKSLAPDTRESLQRCLAAVRKVWPDIGEGI